MSAPAPGPEPGQFDDPDYGLINHELLFSSKLHDLTQRMEEFYVQATANRRNSLPPGSDDEDEEDDEDLYDFDDDDLEESKVTSIGHGHGPNSQSNSNPNCKTVQELSKKFNGKINVEKYDVEGLKIEIQAEAGNKLLQNTKKATANRQKNKDKQDRATVEQVMDPRTRMILYKFLSSDKLSSIDGCISTGKEANVYHATGPEGQSYALKVFKTSILIFKARDKYVSGEFRFRHGYCKKNPRKMVRLWAEKEYRNLLRIHSTGSILVPEPKYLKSHVIVMDFIGEAGWPNPLLKDVKFDKIEEESDGDVQKLLNRLYTDSLLILYKLYKECKLVHADFSEFNLILKDYKDLYVIDVSQSVEHDHPRSFDFLRSDIKNIQDFFGKRHVLIGDYKEIFNWITSPTVDSTNYQSSLLNILSNAKPLSEYKVDDEGSVAQEVFRQVYIPKKMNEIDNYERDYAKVKGGQENGKNEELIYANQMGMKADFSGPKEAEVDSGDSNSSDESTDDEAEGEENEGSKFKNSHRPRQETAEEKRERKKAVKELKAEKRQSKVPKHIKKRKEKLGHANSKK